MTVRGRSCPLSYRYRPEELAGPACCSVSTLYVVGGLYGNTAALHAVLERARVEQPAPLMVFNGDFHYLDADPDAFATIARTVAEHTATLGNIESGLADPHEDAGCGCGYPAYINDDTVEGSNTIVDTLRATAKRFPELVEPLRYLPRHLTVEVGDHRVGIVHGDPENLAGWRLALEAIEPGDSAVRAHTGWRGTPTTPDVIADWFHRMNVEVLACTHTGLPYAQDIEVGGGRRLVVNNGAAGLPCFADRGPGVITRLSTQPGGPADSLYGITLGGLRCDALPVRYDLDAWAAELWKTWAPASPAHTGYHQRITHGTHLALGQAARGSVQINHQPAPQHPETP